MTLQQMQYLTEVYRTGSVSRAAKNLFLAQSSLSASISSIENELGFPVFVRTKKGMIPTVQGSHVITHAARICESYRAMLDTPALCKRHIRISAPDHVLLNNAFCSLADTYRADPGIYFSIDSCCTAEAATRLSAFELDVAILINHEAKILSVDTLLDSMGLQRKQLAAVPAVFQIGPQHRLYDKADISPEDFKGEMFIDNMNDPLIDNDFLKGVIRLSPERTISVKNAHIQRSLLQRGLGYNIAAHIPPSPEALPLRQIPIPGVNYILSAVTNPKSDTPEAVDTYIRLIRQAFQSI